MKQTNAAAPTKQTETLFFSDYLEINAESLIFLKKEGRRKTKHNKKKNREYILLRREKENKRKDTKQHQFGKLLKKNVRMDGMLLLFLNFFVEPEIFITDRLHYTHYQPANGESETFLRYLRNMIKIMGQNQQMDG